MDVAVVGAGITGLVTAYELQKQGISVAVFEKSDRAGGNICTIIHDGFQLELGANSFLLRESARQLVGELGLSPVTPRHGTRFISVANGGGERLVPVALGSILSSSILSSAEKIRLLKEPFISGFKGEDLSVYDFISRRLGAGCAERLMEPFFNGIYAADIKTLSARSSLPKLFEMEQSYGSIFSGLCRSLFQKRTPRPQMVQFPNGLSSLTDTLAAKVNLHLRAEINEVREKDERIEFSTNGETFSAKKIILTSDSIATAKLLAPHDANLANLVREIPHSSVVVSHVACNGEQLKTPIDGVGFLRAPKAGDSLLGVLFSSNSFPHVAPTGSALFTCFTKCRDEKKMLETVGRLLNISGEMQILHTQEWDRAIPNYPVGHHCLVERVRDFENRHTGIKLTGSWIGCPGIADRIEKGFEILSTFWTGSEQCRGSCG